MLQERQVGIGPALEWIRIARLDVGIVVIGIDEAGALSRVLLRQQSADRLLGRKRGVAVIEVAIGEREVHRLIQRVDVAGAVVAHRLQIEVLEDIERLQHHGSLRPWLELVHVDAAILCHYGRFCFDLPVGEIRKRDEPTLLLQAANELLGDVTAIEPLVGGHDGVVAVLAAAERLLLGLHELPQRRREVRLAKDLACLGGFPGFAGVRQHHRARIAPLFEPALVALDRIRRLFFDGIAVGHLDRRLEHVPQAELAVLGEHDHQTAGCAGRDRRERAVLRRVAHPL